MSLRTFRLPFLWAGVRLLCEYAVSFKESRCAVRSLTDFFESRVWV